jgi:hypothetical protein
MKPFPSISSLRRGSRNLENAGSGKRALVIPVRGVPLAMKLSAAVLISATSSSEKGCVQRSGFCV